MFDKGLSSMEQLGMELVVVRGKLFAVTFTIQSPVIKNGRGEELIPTTALVASAAGVGFGVADCSPSDVFNVTAGRQKALARAIARFNLTRSERKTLFARLGL